MIDCAITGPSSANSAGWPEVTTHFMPIGFQIALNGYGINLNTWKKFKPDQQAKLEAAFEQLDDEIWTYSKELFDDAVRCNVGKEPCTTVKKFSMTDVPVSEGDLKLVREAIGSVSFPALAEICDKSYPGCSPNGRSCSARSSGCDRGAEGHAADGASRRTVLERDHRRVRGRLDGLCGAGHLRDARAQVLELLAAGRRRARRLRARRGLSLAFTLALLDRAHIRIDLFHVKLPRGLRAR